MDDMPGWRRLYADRWAVVDALRPLGVRDPAEHVTHPLVPERRRVQ